MPSSLNEDALEVWKHNILLQTAAPKVPAKPTYGKFGKDTLIAHFLKFCKVATKGTLFLKEDLKKHPVGIAVIS